MPAPDVPSLTPAENRHHVKTDDVPHPARHVPRGYVSGSAAFDIRQRHGINIFRCIIHWQVADSSGFSLSG